MAGKGDKKQLGKILLKQKLVTPGELEELLLQTLGSHPHLAHEMISAILEDRDPWPNAVTSANWTCVGICAHESALKGGEVVKLPEFTLDR